MVTSYMSDMKWSCQLNTVEAILAQYVSRLMDVSLCNPQVHIYVALHFQTATHAHNNFTNTYIMTLFYRVADLPWQWSESRRDPSAIVSTSLMFTLFTISFTTFSVLDRCTFINITVYSPHTLWHNKD